MKYFVLTLTLLTIFTFSGENLKAQNPGAKAQVERVSNEFNIAVNGVHITVQNGTPKATLTIYSIIGIKLKEYHIAATGDDLQFDLPKGWYIFKTENIVRKVSVK